jgi:hypothetical protein
MYNNMYKKTYAFFATLFFLYLPSFLGAQTVHYSAAPRSVRLPWPRDDKAWGYEAVIEAELGGTYRDFVREFTHDFFIIVSLAPGRYRYRVIPYNFLGQPETAQSSAWRVFDVPSAVSSVDAEDPIILMDFDDPVAAVGRDNNGNVLPKRGTVYDGNGHSYEVINETKRWTDAKLHCESLGGYLATVTSLEEQKFIMELLSEQGTRSSYWLGGYREGGRWQWVTGEAFDYRNWMAGKPDNNNGREDKLSMPRTGQWDDQNNGLNFGFICEWDSGVPIALPKSGNSTAQIKPEKPAGQSEDNTDRADRLWMVGASAGTAFYRPWIIATLHGTIAPLPYSFLEAGIDLGLISGDTDARYYSIYPFIHYAFFMPFPEDFIPFLAKSGWYIGAGGGYWIGVYSSPNGEAEDKSFSVDFIAGLNIMGMFDISYTLRTSFKGVNNKFSVGYVYRF